MKIDWNKVGFWILALVLILFMGYLIFTGRAWK